MQQPSTHTGGPRPDDVMFVVIDERGTIVEANDAIVRRSGHPRKRLAGEDRSFVLHQDMPRGVPKAAFDEVKAGRMFAGYLRCVTAGGAPYDVFTLALPVDGQFVAIQTNPHDPERLADVQRIWDQVAPIDLAFRSAASPETVVEAASREQLDAVLAQSDHHDLTALHRRLLLAETHGLVAARGRTTAPATDDDAHRVLVAESRWLDTLVVRLHRQAEAMEGVVASLLPAARRMRVAVDADRSSGDAFEAVLRRHLDAASEHGALRVWTDRIHEARSLTREITGLLTALPGRVAAARVPLAATVWLSAALDHTACELATGATGAKATRRAGRLLLRLLAERLPGVVETLDEVRDDAHAVARRADRLGELMTAGAELLGEWQEATAGRLDDVTERLRPEVLDARTRQQSGRDVLDHFAQRCRGVAHPDATELLQELDRLQALVEEL
ncbi:PAS domain-containing protein [uncultured Tessaracoccus sp.]|uniref:PAS domain-containing protein n=1 Tax=uncultured Tessaracoccus sp. TaxID=905023 RepID=UPI0025DEA335|nr:PAS domain-containing protein [uncultured Tessaracoccus sp.]